MHNIEDIEEIQKIDLEILRFFDNVCRENNLTYFLSGGTLLGAIRHKGFILWDDDVDLVMPRKDFEKLIEILDKSDSNYKLFIPGCSEDYFYTFGKLVDTRTVLDEFDYCPIKGMGLYIDIFIMDGLPDDNTLRDKRYKKLEKINRRITLFSQKKPDRSRGLIRYCWNYYHFILYHRGNMVALQRKLQILASEYDYYSSKYVVVIGGGYGKKDIFEQSMFGNGVDEVFEDLIVRIPADYGKELSQLYGDYMQLPPIEKRVSNHNFHATYREME